MHHACELVPKRARLHQSEMPPPDNRVPFVPQGERSTRLGWIRHAAANQVYLAIFGIFLDSSGSLQEVFKV